MKELLVSQLTERTYTSLQAVGGGDLGLIIFIGKVGCTLSTPSGKSNKQQLTPSGEFAEIIFPQHFVRADRQQSSR